MPAIRRPGIDALSLLPHSDNVSNVVPNKNIDRPSRAAARHKGSIRSEPVTSGILMPRNRAIQRMG